MLVGQIGQAKTKFAEAIAKNLLSPIPVVRGTVTNDIPTSIPEDQLTALLSESEVVRTQPEFTVSPECEEIIKANKLETKVDWISGADRYKYILSTPDISVKDLVGQIDAIKIAKKGVELYSMESYSAGQLLQARHGILCIDELPVLDPRKQVSLLSVLQEGKFTTGAYPAVFKPDVRIIATANPIDYTHSGKIIEPLFDADGYLTLKDRSKDVIISGGSNIYPREVEEVLLEHARVREVSVIGRPDPEWGEVVVAYVVGEAERTRSIAHGVKAIPRFCDIHCIHQSSKFELAEMEDTRENRRNILDSIIEGALKEVALEYIQKLATEQLTKVKNDFVKNKAFQVSQTLVGEAKSPDYESQLTKFPGLRQAVNETIANVKEEQKQLIERAKQLGIRSDNILLSQDLNGEFTASVIEVILEGLRYTQPPLLDRKDNSYGLAQ